MSDRAPSAGAGVSDDRPVNHYSLKHRVVAWVSQTVFSNFEYQVRHGINKGLRRRGGLGFLPEFLAGSETAESNYWMSLDLKGKVVYDVGAFEGILACFFARQASHLVCFEPNPPTHERLLANLRINGFSNVTSRKIGLGSKPDTFTILWDPLMPGGASVEKSAQDQMRRSPSTARLREERIEVSTLDNECGTGKLPPPDFIKIDVEGLELEVLKGGVETLRRYGPELFLEMHGETFREKRRKVQELVDFLQDAGYGNILHIESGSPISQSNASVAAEGHLYCRKL